MKTIIAVALVTYAVVYRRLEKKADKAWKEHGLERR